ncbi:MAG TPA: hypothetical protein EYN06_06380 [Myxococcales bacterium]|nr:hypothetical protein [Myxococcales bacterium]HIN86090.1 hypothetical protein [Myxococcales bacterium]
MSIQFLIPEQSFETLAEWGTANLSQVIAIDSQSNEYSETIPSTEGQRRLSNYLRDYFSELGYASEQDDFANLMVRIPATAGAESSHKLAFMVHMDTAIGTRAVSKLEVIQEWDGSRIEYPENSHLNVTAADYPDTRYYQGEDVLHGPGNAPIGLDDKLGMSELMTLGQILKASPNIPHGELFLIFRPDEEIGRMAAVEGLAEELERRGVQYGYTVDGLSPFEINVENFNAAGGKLLVTGAPLSIERSFHRRAVANVIGVNTHGATAKSEGYLNATTVFVQAYQAVASNSAITPVGFETDNEVDVHAQLTFWLAADSVDELDQAQTELQAALKAAVDPHAWRGARFDLQVFDETQAEELSTAYLDLFSHLQQLLNSTDGPKPILSENSDGYEGYTNPFRVTPTETGLELRYRIRDFDEDGLEARKKQLQDLCSMHDEFALELEHQYINMGPQMEAYPELTQWALNALNAIGQAPHVTPIRGGTGVDPFLAKGIPVANLGTGYFAPESEKELTSKQNIARHALWLAHLVQVVSH